MIMQIAETKRNSSTASKKETPRQSAFFHPKPIIDIPDTKYRQDAHEIMRMRNTTATNNLFFKPAITPVKHKCEHCKEEEKQIEQKEINQH